MTTYIPQHYTAAALFRVSELLRSTAGALRSAAHRLDLMIEARRKSKHDRRVLSEMSARELRDIGLGDAYSHALRAGEFRCDHRTSNAIDWRHPM